MGEGLDREVRRVRLFRELRVIGSAHETADRGVGAGQPRRCDAGVRLIGRVAAEGRARLIDIGQEGVVVEIGQVPVELRPVGHHADRIVVDRHRAMVEFDHGGRARGVVDDVVERRFDTAEQAERLQHDGLVGERGLDLGHGGELAERPGAEIGCGEHRLRDVDGLLLAGRRRIGQQAEGQALVVQPLEHPEVGDRRRRGRGRHPVRHGDSEHGVARGELQRRMAGHDARPLETDREMGDLIGQVHREFHRTAEIGLTSRVRVSKRRAHSDLFSLVGWQVPAGPGRVASCASSGIASRVQ